jgi:hypothetical protein
LSAITDLAFAVGASDQEGIQSPPEGSSSEAMETVGPGFALDRCNKQPHYQDLEQLFNAAEPLQRHNDDFTPFISMPPNPDQMELMTGSTPDPFQVISNMSVPEEAYCCRESASPETSEPPKSALLTPCSNNGSMSMWNSLETITHNALASTKQIRPLIFGQIQRAHDDNVLVTALVHGWNLVPEKYLLDPIWQAIRHMDEEILSLYGAVEKLAMMYILALQLSVG